MIDSQVGLTQLTIQSFKSLEFVDIQLGTVNVFIGANGSGKSNLLEALGYLSAAASGQLDDQALLRRGVRPGPPGSFFTRLREFPAPPPTKIVSTFAARGGRVRHSLFQDGDIPASAMWIDAENFIDGQGVTSNSNRRIVGQPGGPLSISESREAPGDEDIARQLRSVTGVLADYGIFAPTTPALRGVVTDFTQRSPVGLAGGQLAEAVRELLKPRSKRFGRLDLASLLNLLDWVDDINVVHPSRDLVPASVPTSRDIIRFTDRWMGEWMGGGGNQLSVYDASEGALYVLFAMVLALHPKAPRLFAIENLDQNMHPRLARATMRLFCSQLLASDPPRQALLTTHNPLALDGLDLRDDRIRLFTIERSAQGATRVDRVPVSHDMLRAIENGLSLSNLWVMGRIGGAPDLF